MKRFIVGSTWDRTNRNGINNNFDYLFNGVATMNNLNIKADATLLKADAVLLNAENINNNNVNVQNQLDNIIIESGTSDAEVVQSRTDSNGNTFPLLKDRLNNIDKSILSRGANVIDFGAVGDGVTDDTNALLTMLDSQYTNFFIPKGKFLITQPINITRNDITIQAEGTLVFDVSEETGLNISGDNNTISVNVDGKDKIRIGINIDGRNNTVTGCSVSNIYSTSDMACGINSRQNGNTVISGNTITNVTSVGNDVGGDNSGASRGIRITGLSTNDGFTVIKDNSVFNVLGEEGDSIHLTARNQTEMEVVVDNNHIYNFSRRAVKIQASNTRITNNKIENYLDYVGLMRTIDIQSVHKTVVDNNEIIVDYVSCFGVTGTETVEVLDTTITNNKVTLLSSETIFNTSYVNGIDFSNNTLVGGTPMIVNRCKNAVISKNVIKDTLTDDTQYAISNLGSSENIIISDNIIKDSVYKAPLRTSTENVIVTGNTFIGTGRGIEAQIGSGIIANNIVKSTVNAIIDGGTENHQILNNIKLTGV